MKSPSFKSELVAFRRHLEPPSKYKDPAYQQAFAKKQKLFFRVVDEWIEYPGFEDLWHKIRDKLPADYLAPRFIAEVLQQRDFAEDLDRATEGLADVEQKNASRTKRLLKEAKGASKVGNLKQIAIENACLPARSKIEIEYLAERARQLLDNISASRGASGSWNFVVSPWMMWSALLSGSPSRKR
jgi:hypothetical protein